jgi:hypothetical protein
MMILYRDIYHELSINTQMRVRRRVAMPIFVYWHPAGAYFDELSYRSFISSEQGPLLNPTKVARNQVESTQAICNRVKILIHLLDFCHLCYILRMVVMENVANSSDQDLSFFQNSI